MILLSYSLEAMVAVAAVVVFGYCGEERMKEVGKQEVGRNEVSLLTRLLIFWVFVLCWCCC